MHAKLRTGTLFLLWLLLKNHGRKKLKLTILSRKMRMAVRPQLLAWMFPGNLTAPKESDSKRERATKTLPRFCDSMN